MMVRPLAPASPLRIGNVRLEAAPAAEPAPSTVLKFEMLNQGLQRLTDVLLEIVIVEKQDLDHDDVGLPRLVVGPFTIRGSVTIESGYTVNYELLLRNLSSDCGCVATVSVVSARALSDTYRIERSTRLATLASLVQTVESCE
jgi:hypothetical protein